MTESDAFTSGAWYLEAKVCFADRREDDLTCDGRRRPVQPVHATGRAGEIGRLGAAAYPICVPHGPIPRTRLGVMRRARR